MAPLFVGALGWAWLASVSLAVAQCTPPAIQKAQPDMPPKCACTIGPVSFQAPACDIKTEEFDEERWDYVVWAVENSNTTYSVILITPKRSRPFKGYLERQQGKCLRHEVRLGEPTRWQAEHGRPGKSLPQVTWSGICASSESYINRAIAVGKQVVKLRVTQNMRRAGPSLEQMFIALLAQVRPSAPQ